MRSRYWIYLILLLPVFIFRDYTPDNELRYISIVEEALQNNTWFTFYNHGAVYADKPPIYFWLIMLSKILFGTYEMWAIGLFSILPAIGIMMVMDRWLDMEGRKHNPFVSNLMLATTGMFLGSTLVLRMDMLMAFFITISLFTFYKIYKQKNKPRDRWLLPVFVFLAIFTKGAMGFLIPIVSIAAFLLIKKEIKHFGRYFGKEQWAILIGLCALWFSLIYFEGGSEYLNNILFKQTVGRGINSFHHKGPVYYYLVRMMLTFAPWSLLYLVTLGYGAWKHKFITDLDKFFFTIIVVNFVMLSLISSKLDIYLLPIYPFVTYLTSILLFHNGTTLAAKICVAVTAIVFALLYPVSYMVAGEIPFEYKNLTMVHIGLFIVSAGGVMSLVYLWRKNISGAITTASLGLLGMIFAASFGIEQFNRYIGYKTMAQEARTIAKEENTERYSYYKFTNAVNMDVYLGQQLECIESVEQLDSLDKTAGPTVLFIRNREVRREKELEEWLSNRAASRSVGDYRIFVVGQEK